MATSSSSKVAPRVSPTVGPAGSSSAVALVELVSSATADMKSEEDASLVNVGLGGREDTADGPTKASATNPPEEAQMAAPRSAPIVADGYLMVAK